MEVKKEYDMDAIYKSISGFVDKYNDVIKNSSASESSGIKKAAGNMTNITDLYANSLKKLGITINGDKTLSIDEKTFKASEVSDIEDTFVGSSSFSKSISSQASFINDAATREATKANTYTSSGSYSNNFSTGDIFTSLF
jgi:flagellar capping protein FliD